MSLSRGAESHSDDFTPSRRHRGEGPAQRMEATGSTRVMFRLSTMAGVPPTIVSRDAPFLRLRTLSQSEVEISGLCKVVVAEGDYWAELELDDLCLLHVNVLHRDSSVVFSKINVYDFMISGRPASVTLDSSPTLH